MCDLDRCRSHCHCGVTCCQVYELGVVPRGLACLEVLEELALPSSCLPPAAVAGTAAAGPQSGLTGPSELVHSLELQPLAVKQHDASQQVTQHHHTLQMNAYMHVATILADAMGSDLQDMRMVYQAPTAVTVSASWKLVTRHGAVLCRMLTSDMACCLVYVALSLAGTQLLFNLLKTSIVMVGNTTYTPFCQLRERRPCTGLPSKGMHMSPSDVAKAVSAVLTRHHCITQVGCMNLKCTSKEKPAVCKYTSNTGNRCVALQVVGDASAARLALLGSSSSAWQSQPLSTRTACAPPWAGPEPASMLPQPGRRHAEEASAWAPTPWQGKAATPQQPCRMPPHHWGPPTLQPP
ncbi:hypothetical protein HaLaN_11016, partial [Haematococcus lacustris]